MGARERDSDRQRTLMINFVRKMEMLEEVCGGGGKSRKRQLEEDAGGDSSTTQKFMRMMVPNSQLRGVQILRVVGYKKGGKIHLGQSHRCRKRKNKKIQDNKIICYLMGSSNFGKSHGNYYRIQVKLKSKFIISSVRLLTNLLKLIHWSSDLARQTVWPFSL